MKKKNSSFVVFTLCLTLGLLAGYASFVNFFNSDQVHMAQVQRLQEELDQAHLEKALLAHQIKDFQQTVAQLLPNEKTALAKYEMRNLSAIVRSPASDNSIDLSPALYERAKKFFNQKSYDRAIESFSALLEKYPLSVHSVEARFFIAESYFLKRDFRNSLVQIDRMVTLYPEHELTGFILLRMGQISQLNHQNEEALEIYRTVMKSFPHKDLRAQAKNLAGGLELL